MSKSKLDPEYLNYERDFNSILKGITEYKKLIPLNNNKNLQLGSSRKNYFLRFLFF